MNPIVRMAVSNSLCGKGDLALVNKADADPLVLSIFATFMYTAVHHPTYDGHHWIYCFRFQGFCTTAEGYGNCALVKNTLQLARPTQDALPCSTAASLSLSGN